MTVSLFSRLSKLKNFIDSIKYFKEKMKYYGQLDKASTYFIFSVYLMHLVKYLNITESEKPQFSNF